MKVYVYGEYVKGINGNRVPKYENVTTALGAAFIYCYEVGLDGLDYFIVEYDPETKEKKDVFLNDPQHVNLFFSVRDYVASKSRQGEKITILRPEDV